MPCPPGFIPVAKVDHATGVCAGRVVATRVNPPCSFSRARLGSWFASSSRVTMTVSSPSKPMTITFLMAPSSSWNHRRLAELPALPSAWFAVGSQPRT